MSWTSETVMVPCPNCGGQLVAEITVENYKLKYTEDSHEPEAVIDTINFNITLVGMEPEP